MTMLRTPPQNHQHAHVDQFEDIGREAIGQSKHGKLAQLRHCRPQHSPVFARVSPVCVAREMAVEESEGEGERADRCVQAEALEVGFVHGEEEIQVDGDLWLFVKRNIEPVKKNSK